MIAIALPALTIWRPELAWVKGVFLGINASVLEEVGKFGVDFLSS